MRVAFVSTASQGKTCLVKRLVSDLKIAGNDCTEVVEFARDYIEMYGPPENLWEQLEFCRAQRAREELAARNYEVLVIDNPIWLPSVYGTRNLDPHSVKDIYPHQKLLEIGLESIKNYDYTFYIRKLFETQFDNVRKDWGKGIDAEKEFNIIDKKILGFMHLYNVKYHVVDTSNIEERVNIVRGVVKL